jgi:hypothetical protein
MSRFLTMKRLGILFGVLFGISLIGVFAIQKFVVGPEQKCVGDGRWWYAEGRECLTPIYLPDITGRPAGVTRAEASDQKNRELLVIERKLEAEDAARRAQTQRDMARLLNKDAN